VTLLQRARAAPPHWASEKILAWDSDAFEHLRRFAVSRYWADSASLNVFRIVGTRHPDYQGKTWSWFLGHGKRMPENLRLHGENRAYYLETGKKQPEMSFISIDGQNWYVDADGNHRSCIARFDFHYAGLTELRGLCVSDWRIDLGLAQAFEVLEELVTERRLPWRLGVVTRTLARQDNPGWMLERYRPVVVVHRPGGPVELDGRGVLALVRDLEQPWYRRWFAARRA